MEFANKFMEVPCVNEQEQFETILNKTLPTTENTYSFDMANPLARPLTIPSHLPLTPSVAPSHLPLTPSVAYGTAALQRLQGLVGSELQNGIISQTDLGATAPGLSISVPLSTSTQGFSHPPSASVSSVSTPPDVPVSRSLRYWQPDQDAKQKLDNLPPKRKYSRSEKDDEEETDEYKCRRLKNNELVRRSRAKAKLFQQQLIAENEDLKRRLRECEDRAVRLHRTAEELLNTCELLHRKKTECILCSQ